MLTSLNELLKGLAVDALPVSGPENPVAVNNPVFGLNVSLVLDTRASVNDPDVAVANVG